MKKLLLVLVIIILLSTLSLGVGFEEREYNLLVIHSYGQDFLWTEQVQAGIETSLAFYDIAYDMKVAYLDGKNYQEADIQSLSKELLEKKYQEMSFDAIITSDNLAMEVALELFPDTQIFSAGINEGTQWPKNQWNLTIVEEKIDPEKNFELMLDQHPEVKRIHLFIDDTLTGKIVKEQILDSFEALKLEEVALISPGELGKDDLVTYLGQLGEEDLVYLALYFPEELIRNYTYEEIAIEIAEQAKVPVYVSWSFYLVGDVVGGYVTSGELHGEAVALACIEELTGTSYGTEITTNRYMYNYNGLQRFHLDLQDGPRGVVINEPTSFWQEQRVVIIIVSVVVMIASIIIGLLTRALGAQAKLIKKEREIHELKDELIKGQDEILYTIGEVIEHRSEDTAKHLSHMASLSRILGKGVGLSPYEVAILEKATPLHDVGKIGIPDEILNKPGKLTEEEFEIMKQHTKIGAKILSNSEKSILKEAANIALYHHEKWDGSGYPEGLAGEDIPISARITAVLDVFDALLQERPYKHAWSFQEAHAYLNEHAGSHFDPRIISIFNESISEILVLYKE